MNKKNTIEYLAYLLDKAKTENKEKAIVFLGAGASVSAGIPLTNVIVRHVKLKFRKNPSIKDLISKGKEDYVSLMEALTADERRDLFHYYVTRDKVKLNIANVYLAQLLRLGYVDYIVTVNFDDLILRACTLFNFLPPVYDFSNIKTITTTDIRTGSVLYLHGQYFGQWLLNNDEELKKVEKEVLNLFNTIKTRRTWIVVGYSGRDGIFDKIKSLGSFSNELFWIKKSFDAENDKHVLDFLDTPNNNTHAITDNYADTFFLKLHAELSKLDTNLYHPDIFSKPFTFLKSVMQNVNEINEEDDLNKEVKGYVESSVDRIDKAINRYENKETLENFKQKIIDAILKKNFSDDLANSFEQEMNEKGFDEAKNELNWYFDSLGNYFLDLAKINNDVSLYKQSFKKYEKAISINPKNEITYYNYGTALTNLAKNNEDKVIFNKSIKQFERAIAINPNYENAYNNLGIALKYLAEINNDEILFKQSFQQFEIAISFSPNHKDAYYNYANALNSLAKINKDEKLFRQSFKQFERAISINPKDEDAFNNYGIAISNLAKIKKDELLYKLSFEQYETAININQKNAITYYNYGNVLSELAEINKDEALFKKGFIQYNKAIAVDPKNHISYNNYGTALMKFAALDNNELFFKRSKDVLLKAYELGGSPYNLACVYAITNKKDKALKYLEESFINKHIETKFVAKDKDWQDFLKDKNFIALLKKHS